MKKILLLLFVFASIRSFAQAPSMDAVIMPQYMIGGDEAVTEPGDPGDLDFAPDKDIKTAIEDDEPVAFSGVPYVMRATLKMGARNANKTYRYFVSAIEAQNPELYISNFIGIKLNGDFERSIYPDFFDTYGEFKTDAAGNYTGWFIYEPNANFIVGEEYFLKIVTNDGAGSEAFEDGGGYEIITPFPVKIVAYTTNSPTTQCTGIRSIAAAGATAKNFVFLYDNEAGTGRPVTGSLIENDNIVMPVTDFNTTRINVGYAKFYVDNVDGKDKTWGSVIPGNLPGGIKRIAQYKFADGSLVGANTSATGIWPAPGGQTVDTKNNTGGLTNVIVVDGTKVNLLQDQGSQTVTFEPLVIKTFGDAPFTTTATASSGLPVTFTSGNAAVATVTGNTVTIIAAGTTDITAAVAGNDQFGPATAVQTLTVNKAGQTIVFNQPEGKAYGDDAFTISATVNSPLVVSLSSDNPNVATISGNRVTITGAGSAVIRATQPGNTNYSAATAISRTLTVSKAPLTITAEDKPKGLNEPVPTLTATYSGFKYNDNANSLTQPVRLTTTATQTSPPGEYPITASGATSADYDISFVSGTLSVFSNSLNITFEPISQRTYGDAPFDPGSIAESGTQPTYSSSNVLVAAVDTDGKIKITGAGNTVIAANFPASGSFPPGIKEQGLIVAKKPLQVLPENKNRPYGQENPVFTATYTGFVNDDDASDLQAGPVFTTTATTASVAGVYPVTASGALSDNYLFSYTEASLTVDKATVNVVPADATRVYGEANPAFSVTYTGFVNNENESVLVSAASATTTAVTSSDAGTYPIQANGASATNYEFTYSEGVLTITPGLRTLSFDPLPVKTLGDTDFNPGAVISSSEAATYTSSNTSVATIVNGLVHLIGAGNTTITATTPANQNYTNTQAAERELIVSKAAQVITFSEIPVQRRGGPAYTLKVSSSSGLPVQLSISDSLLASLDELTLQSLRVGTARIIATQSGNENYLPAQQVERGLTINDEDGDVIRVHPAISIDGDGINEFLTIEGIQNYPYNHVTIINRNGLNVFDIQNYDNKQNVFVGKRKPGDENLPAGTYFCLVEYNVNSEKKRKTSYFILKY